MKNMKQSVVSAIAVLAIATSAAQATLIGLANGNFESGFIPPDMTDVPYWYESTTLGYTDFVVAGTLSGRMSGLNNTALGALQSGGFLYQQIGTYTANESFVLNGEAWRERNGTGYTIPGLTVSLYSGNITPVNGNKPGALGATLLDSVAKTSAQLGFVVGTPNELASVQPFTIALNAGTGGTPGVPLWLLLEGVGGSGSFLYLDNLVFIPEPSVAALLGVGALLAFRRRSPSYGGQGRRRK